MSDSQRPKLVPAATSFEVPDLELGPAPRTQQSANAPTPASQQDRAYTAPNLFEEDGFEPGTLSLDLDAAPRANAPLFGASLNSTPDSFELELELSAAPHSSLQRQAEDSSKASSTIGQPGAHAAWPTGCAPEAAQLRLDPIAIAILADYGEIPRAVQLTPAYAYRVFTRQRELKRQLIAITAECERAQLEREATLAELGRAVRPAAEKVERFRRILAPLLELEQVAGERERALSSLTQQLSGHSDRFDAELARIAEQVTTQQRLEQEAARAYDEREAIAKRASAIMQRVHIEIRAVTRVAEQKVGPAGGEIPEPEASQLDALRQRLAHEEPAALHAQAELGRANAALEQARAHLEQLRQSERSSTRKKQALGEQYRNELQSRSEGVSESQGQQRAALADLGRAVLAAAGTVDVSDAWLERVRVASAHADELLVRREMHLRAIDGYDRVRARQGVHLVCTLLGLLVLLVSFKLIF